MESKIKVGINNIENIEIHGFIENLQTFYSEANAVVMPIKIGTGMKVKVAEALMFGKSIIGTPIAFEGYEFDKEIAKLCNSEKEFIDFLNNHQVPKYNNKSRKLFLEKYSF